VSRRLLIFLSFSAVLAVSIFVLPGPTFSRRSPSVHYSPSTAPSGSQILLRLLLDAGQAPVTTTTTTAPSPVVSVPPTTEPLPPPVQPASAETPLAVDTSSAEAWANSPAASCVRGHESGGNYADDTGNGFYGAWQFLPSTFSEYVAIAGFPQYADGDQSRPDLAPPDVQDAAAFACWQADGWHPWPRSSALCGLG
jgi:Transglycosylase-like domain